MKKKFLYIKIGLLTLSVLLLTGCNDYLDVSNKNFITDDVVWKSSESADLFLNDIYEQLPNMNSETEHLDQFTDNSDVGVLWMRGYSNIATAQVTPTNFPDVPWKMWHWSENYKRIRRCNIFIKKVSESTNLSDDYKTTRLAEARFLRAMFYHWLWLAHGGVPVIEEPLDNISMRDDIYRPRNTARETFEFIVKELSEVANDLPVTVNKADYGRPTKGAALTLKGWCELYEASPLRNPSNDIERWRVAAKTNKEVIDLGVYDLVEDFTALFMEDNNNSVESIFAKQYGPKKGSSIEGKQGPVMNGVGAQVSWGNFQPTQELVDEFSMANGKPIDDPASGYDPQNPYKGREKRFYQTILHDGAKWRDYTITTRKGGNNEIDLGYGSDKTHTGYYTRKRLNENKDPKDYFSDNSYQNYMFFRYAEVLLNFAEAENEVNGPTADVLAAVNKVRTRGNNLPTVEVSFGSVSKDQMREIIHRERRVEFAFEDKRWWDVLRWKIADKLPDGSPGVLNRPEKGMLITEKGGGILNYEVVEVRNRIFLPKMYLMPVPQSAIDQNPSMSAQNGGEDNWVKGQNPGY